MTVWIVIEAVNRLASPEHVDGLGLAVIAAGGLVVNVVGVVIIGHAGTRDLNMRGAFVHLAADAIGSLGALTAGIVIIITGDDRVDPAISIFIALLVVWAAWGLLRDTTHVLLEGTPRGVDADEVAAALAAAPGVSTVHHLHVWELASDMPALSAHVVLTDEPSLHDAQARGDELKALLAQRFGIDHTTLELECHDCEESVPRCRVTAHAPRRAAPTHRRPGWLRERSPTRSSRARSSCRTAPVARRPPAPSRGAGRARARGCALRCNAATTTRHRRGRARSRPQAASCRRGAWSAAGSARAS